MNNNTIVIIVALVVILGGGYFLMKDSSHVSPDQQAQVAPSPAPEPVATPTAPTPSASTGTPPVAASTKSFEIRSWMERTADGQMSAHFSLPEIKVKKGDRVKITVTNTAGTHDFKIDEYAIAEETPLNAPTIIEFVADKVGTFEYYCSKYNHRQLGQRGNLIVE